MTPEQLHAQRARDVMGRTFDVLVKEYGRAHALNAMLSIALEGYCELYSTRGTADTLQHVVDQLREHVE